MENDGANKNIRKMKCLLPIGAFKLGCKFFAFQTLFPFLFSIFRIPFYNFNC